MEIEDQSCLTIYCFNFMETQSFYPKKKESKAFWGKIQARISVLGNSMQIFRREEVAVWLKANIKFVGHCREPVKRESSPKCRLLLVSFLWMHFNLAAIGKCFYSMMVTWFDGRWSVLIFTSWVRRERVRDEMLLLQRVMIIVIMIITIIMTNLDDIIVGE